MLVVNVCMKLYSMAGIVWWFQIRLCIMVTRS